MTCSNDFAGHPGRDQGRIARAERGSHVWRGDKYRIVRKSSASGGQTATKVGRTTGLTFGTVLETCARTDVAGTNITMLCQQVARGLAMAGDSGSPVFTIENSPQVNDVTLRGILWGAAEDGDPIVFSSIFRVQTELGTMNLCATGFNC